MRRGDGETVNGAVYSSETVPVREAALASLTVSIREAAAVGEVVPANQRRGTDK